MFLSPAKLRLENKTSVDEMWMWTKLQDKIFERPKWQQSATDGTQKRDTEITLFLF